MIDVGSNTVRLLVASVAGDTVRTLREERVHVGLGEEILHHGRVRRRKLDEVVEVTRDYARIARKLGVRDLETVVTAPGRQGESPERLIEAIGRATAANVRVVSAEEEGKLAFTGAVSRASLGDDVVAVCDVGGGSTEVVVGTQLLGPAWVRSVDLGSLRLTAARFHDDPPTGAQIDAAREIVRATFAAIDPPKPETALATGGSARAVARIIGHDYDADDLEHLVELLASKPAAASSKSLGVRPDRARTLLAGSLVLAEVSRLLGRPFAPSRGGIREGAAFRLAARGVAAA